MKLETRASVKVFLLQQPRQGSPRLQKLNGFTTKVKIIFVSKVQIRGCNISGLARAQCRRAEPNRAQTEPNRARLRGDRRDEPPARKLPSPAGRLSAGSQATEATLLTNMSPLTSSERAGAKTAIQRKRRLPATLQLPPLILPQLSGSSML